MMLTFEFDFIVLLISVSVAPLCAVGCWLLAEWTVVFWCIYGRTDLMLTHFWSYLWSLFFRWSWKILAPF